MKFKMPPIRKVLLALLLSCFIGCGVKPISIEMGNPKWGVEMSWHGHSCFTLRDSTGRTIVIDPFDETVGYGRLKLFADLLLISHDHFDHNFKPAVKARLRDLDVIESTGTYSVAGGLGVLGLPSFHDDVLGQKHGPNRMYVFQLGGLKFLHLGDMGHLLSIEQLRDIGKVDVVFVPVGGITTTDAVSAFRLATAVQSSIIIPMHYGDVRFYRLDPLEKFTMLFDPPQVKFLNEKSVRLRISTPKEKPEVWVLPVSGQTN
ncbi:MAG: MBL fold metallo-hydrolase [Elusimicrobiota bacterium]